MDFNDLMRIQMDTLNLLDAINYMEDNKKLLVEARILPNDWADYYHKMREFVANDFSKRKKSK